MDIVFRHFWLLCGVWCGFGNAMYFRFRLRKSISDLQLTEREANRFAIGFLLVILIPCLTFWVLQITSGPQATSDFETWLPIQRNIGHTVILVCWIALFSWVWFFKGAELLSKYYNLAGLKPKFMNHPFVFRGLALFILIGAIFFIKDKIMEEDQGVSP